MLLRRGPFAWQNSVAKLLSYHLVKGLYRRANLKKGLRLSTYNGANITVNRYRKSVRNRTYEVIHFVDVARRQAAVNRFASKRLGRPLD